MRVCALFALAWTSLVACGKADQGEAPVLLHAAEARGPVRAVASSSAVDGGLAPASSAARSSPSAPDGGGLCGTKPLPDCPLQAWMRARTVAAGSEDNLFGLADAFDDMTRFAPDTNAFATWSSIAKDGAEAARHGSIAGARAACLECHRQHTARYRAEMRTRPVAPLPSP